MDLLEALLWSKCKIDLKDYCIEKVKYNNKTYIVPEMIIYQNIWKILYARGIIFFVYLMSNLLPAQRD